MSNELEIIGEDFYRALEDLTFNSRPIIQTLTILAQENVHAGPYIARAVEKRIEKAVPNQKLYAFYLLDSISKNVGSPYTLLFGQKLFQTFTQAFLLVDDIARKKFIDLFKTWKVAKTSSGLPLFPPEPIQKVEQFLIKASSLYNQPSKRPTSTPTPTPGPQVPLNQPNPQHLVPPQIQQQQQQRTPEPQVTSNILIPIVDHLLNLTTERQKLNPTDQDITKKIQIINQLKFAIQSQSLDQNALLKLKIDLESMTKSEESFIKKNSPKPQQPSLQNLLKPSPSPIPVLQDSSGKNPLGLLNNIANLRAPKKDLSSLISNLESKGLVKDKKQSSNLPPNSVLKSLLSKSLPKTSSTPQPALNSTTSSNPLAPINPYAQFKLDNKLNIDPTEAYNKFFIQQKPNKCGTCGVRFSNSEEGQLKRRNHLDWHFRINKRLKEAKIVQVRSWYIDDEDFVQFRDWEIFNGDGSSKNSQNDDVKVEKEKKYVVVPEGGDMNIICGICKDFIKAKFNDDLGEWIWDDCVDKNGRVFHDSCFEESTKDKNSTTISGLQSLQGLLNKKRELDNNGSVDIGMLKDIVKNVKLNPKN